MPVTPFLLFIFDSSRGSLMSSHHTPVIPVIDLSDLPRGTDPSQYDYSRRLDVCSHRVQEVAREIYTALSQSGVMYISGHGVPTLLQEQLMTCARAFFSLPLEVKREIAMHKAGLSWRGYFEEGMELTSGRPDAKEGLYLGEHHPKNHPLVIQKAPMHGQNIWPTQPEAFQEVFSLYFNHMKRLAECLMSLIAIGLGLPPSYFVHRFTSSPTCLFRIFNYPPHSWEDTYDEWGVREHTDMGFLTLLLQDQLGGLQMRALDGSWINVPPLEGTYVVNIGDMLELWTWGRLHATLHRVKSPTKQSRLSFPFFYDPHWNAHLARIDPKLFTHSTSLSHRSLTQPLTKPLKSVHKAAEERWDGLDLHRLSEESKYGDFVWRKIRDVFPHLDPSITNH